MLLILQIINIVLVQKNFIIFKKLYFLTVIIIENQSIIIIYNHFTIDQNVYF